MRALPLAVVALPLSGCVGNFEESRTAAIAQHRAQIAFGVQAPARDDAHCDSLDSRHSFFTYAAWGTGVGSGAAGVVAGAIQGTDDATKNARIYLGISAGVLAGAAVTSTKFAVDAASDWARECAVSQ